MLLQRQLLKSPCLRFFQIYAKYSIQDSFSNQRKLLVIQQNKNKQLGYHSRKEVMTEPETSAKKTSPSPSSSPCPSYRRPSLVDLGLIPSLAGPLSLSALIITDKQLHPERFTCLLEGTGKEAFLKRLQDLQATCHSMSSFFHEYDFHGVAHNGFRSFVKVLILYLNNVEKLLNDECSVRFKTSSSIRKTSRALKEYEAASILFLHQVRVLMMIRDNDVKKKKRMSQVNDSLTLNQQDAVSDNQDVDVQAKSEKDASTPSNETEKSDKSTDIEEKAQESVTQAPVTHSLTETEIKIFVEMLTIDSSLLLPFFAPDVRNFWLHPHSRKVMDIFLSRTISKLVPFHQSIWLNLFDSEGKKATAINYTLNATIDDQQRVWSLMEDRIARALTAIKFIGSSGRIDWFTFPRQTQAVFNSSGKLSFDASGQQERNLSMYSLQSMFVSYSPKGVSPDDSLIFHCHGGGFVCMTPKGHEPYLRYWAEQTQVPVLCPNYGKAPANPYPCGLQDILDSFLFITSGREEVQSALGFHPKNIVVTGDSAGGNLALTLTLALAQYKQQVNPKQILPRAVFVQYPCGDPSVTINASRTFISFDPLLTIASVFSIGSAYSGIDLQESQVNGTNNNNLKEGSELCNERDKSESKNDCKVPWFRRSQAEVISVANKIACKSTDPFFNPLSCKAIPSDVIDNIPIFIQACEFDPLLDDSIAIAKWYEGHGGSVVLDVVEGVQHGFMIAIGHKSLQTAVDVSVTRLKQGLGFLPTQLPLRTQQNVRNENQDEHQDASGTENKDGV